MSAATIRNVTAKKIRRRASPIGAALKAARARAELSQRTLAELAGVSPTTIATIESGVVQFPDSRTVRKLAPHLGLRPSELEDAGAESPVEPLLAKYLADPLAAMDKPTEDELDWFRGQPGAFFFEARRAGEHIPEAMHLLLMLHRASSRKK